MVRHGAVALALAAGLGACGDGESGKPGAATTGTATTAAGPTFRAADVGFTFSYPKGFKQVDEPNDGKVLAEVTPTPGDVKNAIKVRKTGDTELPFASYAPQFRSQFEAQLGVKLSQREETHGGISFGVLEWSKPFAYTDLGQRKTTRLSSASWFFAGAGKTWQIECISDSDHRAEIDAACRQAIGSIRFR